MDKLTIFFDLDDTLYDRSIPYERAFSQFFGGRYAEKLPQAFDAVIHRGYEVFTERAHRKNQHGGHAYLPPSDRSGRRRYL